MQHESYSWCHPPVPCFPYPEDRVHVPGKYRLPSGDQVTLAMHLSHLERERKKLAKLFT